MSNLNTISSIDRAAMDGYAAYASGARMPARYAADDLLASSWRVGRRQAEESAATEKAGSEQASAAPVLRITVRSNYGAPAIYPANDAARIFAAIAGTKTLQLNTLNKIKSLGYRIVRDGDSIEVPGLAALVEQQC